MYERVNEYLRLSGDAVPLRGGMGVDRELALAGGGSTLEPGEIADVASALEGLYELREWFCGDKAEAKVRVCGFGLRVSRSERKGFGAGEGGVDQGERRRVWSCRVYLWTACGVSSMRDVCARDDAHSRRASVWDFPSLQ